MSDIIVTSREGLQNEVSYGDGQTLVIDQPANEGGAGLGPDPYTLLLAALGGCINMTVTLYARRKGWPLERVTVRLRKQRIHVSDCDSCEKNPDRFIHRIARTVTFEGNLTDEQRERLLDISHKCPVHKMLTSEIVITDYRE